MPVFADGELVAWTANIAHWNDVGGMVPGSISTDAKEIYQEGLRIPAVKLVDAGEANQAVLRIMEANSRLPDFLRGDMWAGIAAVRIGARRLQELVAKYGHGTFVAALAHFMDHGEQVSRKALRELPHGTFALEEEQDSGAVYRVTVEISDDEFVVDLRDNPDQDPGPNNSGRDGATVAAQMLFKALTDPYGAANGGSFRPLTVLTRPGSVFDASEPAAFAVYYEVEMRLYDLIWRCLAPALGGLLPAGHFASICGTFIGGPHPDSGRHFTIVEPQVGGWGGSARGDGNSAIFSGFHGETYNRPAEVAESRYGLYVDRMSLNDAGRRGGRAARRARDRRRVPGPQRRLLLHLLLHPQPPPPVGDRGRRRGLVQRRRGDPPRRHERDVRGRDRPTVDEGDVIRIRTGNGGGFGDPRDRSRAAVEADVRNGLLSAERAREVYGYE